MLSDYIDFAIPPSAAHTGAHAIGARSRSSARSNTASTVRSPRGSRTARRCRWGFVAGTHSREVKHVGLDMTRRIVGERLEWVDGSHLFPMERPIDTARTISRMIRALA